MNIFIMGRTIIVILPVLLILSNYSVAVPYEDFIGYPFGEEHGDQLFPPILDHSIPILVPNDSLPFGFPFFGEKYPYIIMNVHGALSFHREPISFTTYTPRSFPLNASSLMWPWARMIAPYWSDVDITVQPGSITYRILYPSNSSGLLSCISQMSGLKNFRANWGLIVTWNRVGYYQEHNDKLNTFQAVLVTDGIKSVTIFNYADDGINWIMTDTGGVLVGYNAGDNIRYLEVNGSLTERIAFIDEIPGNTGEIGKWIFRLNQEFVNIDVSISGNDIVISPESFQYTCIVNSSSAVVFSWYFEGIEVSQLSGIFYTVITTESTIQESVLTINETKPSFGGTYECRAHNTLGIGNDARILTVLDKPDPPENVTITGSTDRDQFITWDNGFNGNLEIIGYDIYINSSRNPDLSPIDLAGVKGEAAVTLNGTTAVISNLIPFVEYSYAVTICNLLGCSKMSDISNSVWTDPAIPDQEPTNCIATVMSPTTIEVTWKAPDPPNGILRDYRIVFKPITAVADYNPMDFEGITNMTTGNTTTEYSITGLQEAVRYDFMISAINQVGEGPLTTTDCSAETDESYPKAPMNVSVYSPGPTSLMATWDHPLPQDRNGIITDYLISIKITDDSEDMFLINSNSNETSYTIKGLRESTEYIVSIAAVTSVGIGVESNDVIHKTLNDNIDVNCPSEEDALWGFQWEQTAPNVTVIEKCDENGQLYSSSGIVTRKCNSEGVWLMVNTSQCQSSSLADVEEEANEIFTNQNSGEPVSKTVAEKLNNLTVTLQMITDLQSEENKPIFPRDLEAINTFIAMTSSLAEDNGLFNTSYNEETLVEIVNNVLDTSQEVGWSMLTETNSTMGSPELLQNIERISSALSNNLQAAGVSEKVIAFSNIILSSMLVDSTNSQISPDDFVAENSSIPFEDIPEIELPLTKLVSGDAGIPIPISLSLMKNLDMFLPRRFQNGSMLPTAQTVPGTIVTSVQVASAYTVDSDDEKLVTINFPITEDNKNVELSGHTCAFWKFDDNSLGGWSTIGLSTQKEKNGMVTCSSTHLTSFTVLVNVAGVKNSKDVALAFSILSYIGCAISMIALILTILFLVICQRKVLISKVNNFVLLNLSIALLLGLTVFCAGIQTAKSSYGGCTFVGVLLHYLFLAAFSWMLCEGVLIYNLLVKVFGVNDRKWIYIYSALGWGLPLPAVIVTAAARYDNIHIRESLNKESPLYHEIRACWLSSENGVIFAFVGPIIGIMIVNTVFLCMAMVSLWKNKFGKSMSAMSSPESKTNLKAGWQLVKATIILMPLMGITWIIGLFAVSPHPATFAFSIAFIILNSLQGLFIFLLHVVRHDKVGGRIAGFVKKRKVKLSRDISSSKVTTTVKSVELNELQWNYSGVYLKQNPAYVSTCNKELSSSVAEDQSESDRLQWNYNRMYMQTNRTVSGNKRPSDSSIIEEPSNGDPPSK